VAKPGKAHAYADGQSEQAQLPSAEMCRVTPRNADAANPSLVYSRNLLRSNESVCRRSRLSKSSGQSPVPAGRFSWPSLFER